MKSLVFTFLSLFICTKSFAMDPLLARSERFAETLGLQTSLTNLPVVHWTMPTNLFSYGELSGRFKDVSGHADYDLELTNSVGTSFAKIELNEYSSNAEALVCLSFLAGGGSSATLEDVASLTVVRTNNMGMAEIGAVTGTQTQQKLWKWCLYRNIGLECQTVQTVDAMDLSVIILRAGGIAIPDTPPPAP